MASFKGSLAVVVNSVHKLAPENYQGATVYIDEVHQLLFGLYSSIFNDRRLTVIGAFRDILRGAERVIVADKDVTEEDVRWLMALMDINESQIHWIYNYYVPQGRRAHWHASRNSILSTLIERVEGGHKLFVATDSKTEAEHLARHLEDLGLRVLLFTADTDDKTRHKVMADINHAVTGYDALIVSPALFTGVDLSTPHFDDVFLLATNTGHHGAGDYMQALHRVRLPTGEVHVWVQHKDHKLPTEPDAVLRSVAPVLQVPFTLGITQDVHNLLKLMYRHYGQTQAQQNGDANSLREVFKELLLKDKYEVVPILKGGEEIAAISKAFEASGKDESSILEEIMAAPVSGQINPETGSLTFDTRLFFPDAVTRVARRYYRANGNSNKDFEHVMRHPDPSVFENEVENFELATLPLSEIEERERLESIQSMGLRQGGLVERARLLRDMLDAVGGLESGLSFSNSGEEAQRLLHVFTAHAPTLAKHYRQKPPKPSKVIHTLSSLLKKMGLTLKEKKPRIDGKQVRFYSFHQERAAVMQGVAHRRNDLHQRRSEAANA